MTDYYGAITDTKQSPTNLGLFLEGVYCLVVFQTYFNPNNSLLIILQISLLFGFTTRLKAGVNMNTSEI